MAPATARHATAWDALDLPSRASVSQELPFEGEYFYEIRDHSGGCPGILKVVQAVAASGAGAGTEAGPTTVLAVLSREGEEDNILRAIVQDAPCELSIHAERWPDAPGAAASAASVPLRPASGAGIPSSTAASGAGVPPPAASAYPRYSMKTLVSQATKAEGKAQEEVAEAEWCYEQARRAHEPISRGTAAPWTKLRSEATRDRSLARLRARQAEKFQAAANTRALELEWHRSKEGARGSILTAERWQATLRQGERNLEMLKSLAQRQHREAEDLNQRHLLWLKLADCEISFAKRRKRFQEVGQAVEQFHAAIHDGLASDERRCAAWEALHVAVNNFEKAWQVSEQVVALTRQILEGMEKLAPPPPGAAAQDPSAGKNWIQRWKASLTQELAEGISEREKLALTLGAFRAS